MSIFIILFYDEKTSSCSPTKKNTFETITTQVSVLCGMEQNPKIALLSVPFNKADAESNCSLFLPFFPL